MSTFGDRVEHCVPTILSILSGKRVPDKFYIWYPRAVHRLGINGFEKIPQILEDLEMINPILSANIAEDYGPATKLIPTLHEEKDFDTIIITIDDDTIYHPYTVLDLEQAMIERPDHAIGRVCELPDKPSKSWPVTDQNVPCHGFACAYASVAYRRRFFDLAVLANYSAAGMARDGCWAHDDVWISGHLWKAGVPIWNIGAGERPSVVLHRRYHPELTIGGIKDVLGIQAACLDYFAWFHPPTPNK